MTPQVVLDTNVIVSALLLESGRLAWLRHAWMAGRCRPLVSRATTAELLRVLSYPKFRLAPDEIEALLGDLLPFAEVVEVNPRTGPWPGLSDPDDRMFLDLAETAPAEFLVTGDRELRAAGAPGECQIVTPAEFLAILKDPEGRPRPG